MLLVCAAQNFSHNDKPNRWAQYDTGAAVVSLCLQATALGLASHQMGGFDAQQAIERFGIPENFTPMAVVAVGYQGELSELDEPFQAAESARRQRQPLPARFFADHWGKSA